MPLPLPFEFSLRVPFCFKIIKKLSESYQKICAMATVDQRFFQEGIFKKLFPSIRCEFYAIYFKIENKTCVVTFGSRSVVIVILHQP